ncbi:hypothetical protein P3L10_001263 [Capsicum annuum]
MNFPYCHRVSFGLSPVSLVCIGIFSCSSYQLTPLQLESLITEGNTSRFCLWRPIEEILKLLPSSHLDTKRGGFSSSPLLDSLNRSLLCSDKKMTSGSSGDQSRPDKNSKSIAKNKSRTPINPDDIPGRLSSQPQMHTSSSGRSYVPFGTGNPIDYHGPRKQRQVCTSYAPHTLRPPTNIGTLILSSDNSDSDA